MLFPVVFGALLTLPMLFITMAESELFARIARLTENRNETIVKKRMQQEIIKNIFFARLPPINLKARKNSRVTPIRTKASVAHPLEENKLRTFFIQVTNIKSGTSSILSKVCALANCKLILASEFAGSTFNVLS